MKKLIIVVLVIIFTSQIALSAVIQNGSFSDGTKFVLADKWTNAAANYGKWYAYKKTGVTKQWNRFGNGGNPGAYAGINANSANFCALMQIVKDDKKTKNTKSLGFSIKAQPVSGYYNSWVFVFGYFKDKVPVSMDLGHSPSTWGTENINYKKLYTKHLTGTYADWKNFAAVIDFKTGYDYLLVAFSGSGGANAEKRPGIDNVFIIPEPGSILLLSLGVLLTKKKL